MGNSGPGLLRATAIGVGAGFTAGAAVFVVAPGSTLLTAVLLLAVLAAASYGLYRLTNYVV